MSPARVAWREMDGLSAVEAILDPPSLAPMAEALFPDIRVEPREEDPELALRETGPDRYRLSLPAGDHELEGLSDAFVWFEMALAQALIRSVEGCEAVHAGGIEAADGPGGLLFSGYGGAGKSTLTVAFGRAGRPVYGDDVVLIERDTGRIRPFHRLLKLPEESRRALGLPRPEGPLAELWPEASFYRPGQLGSAWAPPAPVAHLVFPARDRALGDDFELDPLPGGETLSRLLRQILLVRRPGALAFRTLSDAVADATFHELRYGEAAAVVPILEEMLRGTSA